MRGGAPEKANHMIKAFIEIFRKSSPLELARQELEDAQRDLLHSQSNQEFARRMTEYNQDRIRRLSKYVADAGKAVVLEPAAESAGKHLKGIRVIGKQVKPGDLSAIN